MALSAQKQVILRTIERNPGRTWQDIAKLTIGHIKRGAVKRTIDHCLADEYIMATQEEPGAPHIYMITAAGQAELDIMTPKARR